MAFGNNNNNVAFIMDASAAKSVDDYLEYRRIVGDDDGGKLFTPEEYEQYKKNVVAKRMKNRLFVSWVSNTSQIECKQIGPETKCFCNHRYKQHKTDFDEIPSTRPLKLPCKESNCMCRTFSFVPTNGSRPIRCTCKHFADEHSVTGLKKCSKSTCSCKKFHGSFTCGCGQPTYDHKTLIETKEERLSRGKPVGLDNPYQAMGGLTGFSSLADGYMRLDESGIGAPSREFLEQPSSAFDHPFLRMYSPPEDLPLEKLSLKQKEENDMAYFERRYQQRLKEEKEMKRKEITSIRNRNKR